MDYRSQLGKNAEQFVANYLEKKGFTILAQNYRIRRAEIDLIAIRGTLLVFVEVKMRQEEQQFDLSDVITPGKQYKIIQAAKTYIALHGYEETDCRFDVALIEGADMKHTYIPNAFNESDCTW